MKKNKFNTPILFLIFNRPETEKRVFEIIRKVKPQVLYIAADGPRKNKVGEKEKCRLARKIVDEGVDWDCKIHKLYRNKNLGCKVAVSGAIDWFFKHNEEGIILEDDCLPDITFFKFCSTLLEKYRNNEKVMHIGGTNFQNGIKHGKGSYYFSKYPHIWGWATWRRAWKKYNVDISDWRTSDSKIFDNSKPILEKLFWFNNFNLVVDKLINTWDYQWVYCVFKNHGMCINPNINLVINIGFGSESTHTQRSNETINNMNLNKLNKVKHPPTMKINKYADDFVLKNGFGVNSKNMLKIIITYPYFLMKKYMKG